jgi:hypothetical protein
MKGTDIPRNIHYQLHFRKIITSLQTLLSLLIALTGLCIAEHESSLNTAARGGPNTDGSYDNGIFQVSKNVTLRICSTQCDLKKRRRRNCIVQTEMKHNCHNSGHYPSSCLVFKTHDGSYSYLTGNTLLLHYEPNRLMRSISLWRWYTNITVTIVGIIRVRVSLRLTVRQSVCLGVEPRLGLMTR